MSSLLPVAEALGRILAGARPATSLVELTLIDALGLVLGDDVVSPVAVPGEANSAMDGYALRAADAGSPLPVSQRIAAGGGTVPLAPGTAARIFTGAPVPPGADAVVMQEDCREEGGRVSVTGPVAVGQNIRPRGQDIAEGAVVLSRGRILRPQDLGLLASVGRDKVRVCRPLRVAVLATGDELVEPGRGPLRPGQAYNSNRFTLAGLLRALRLEPVDGGIVADDADATADALQAAAAGADCVITSGGVSVGEEDHVKAQVQRLGSLDLWKLAIKPGKPLAFGRIGDTPFIGLPGNPTSVFVTFCLIARPFLLRLQGAADEELAPPAVRVKASFSVDRPGSRQEYLRVAVVDRGDGPEARLFPNQSSGVLSSVSYSNALAVIPPGTTVAPGDAVEILLLDTFC